MRATLFSAAIYSVAGPTVLGFLMVLSAFIFPFQIILLNVLRQRFLPSLKRIVDPSGTFRGFHKLLFDTIPALFTVIDTLGRSPSNRLASTTTNSQPVIFKILACQSASPGCSRTVCRRPGNFRIHQTWLDVRFHTQVVRRKRHSQIGRRHA